MQKITLAWSFLDAIDGSALAAPPPEYQSKKVKRLQGYDLTPNEIGCYLSHKAGWQRCVETDMTTLILEDDFVLTPHFEQILTVLLNDITSWSLVRLQGLYEVPCQKIAEKSGVSLVKNQGDAVGATAYVLKPEAARQLIVHAADIYEPVDHFLEHHQKHGLTFLAIIPYPVDITRAVSTIADRSEREPVTGFHKRMRSLARVLDRLISKDPWFPK